MKYKISEKTKEYKRQWAQNNKDRLAAKKREWYAAKRSNPEYLQKVNKYHKEYARKSRISVLQHYSNGTMKCSCCGEDNIEFLCIDHIGRGGNKHRKSLSNRGHSSLFFYRWLIRNGFPIGYRVLCHNCNLSYGFYGYCPHQKKK